MRGVEFVKNGVEFLEKKAGQTLSINLTCYSELSPVYGGEYTKDCDRLTPIKSMPISLPLLTDVNSLKSAVQLMCMSGFNLIGGIDGDTIQNEWSQLHFEKHGLEHRISFCTVDRSAFDVFDFYNDSEILDFFTSEENAIASQYSRLKSR